MQVTKAVGAQPKPSIWSIYKDMGTPKMLHAKKNSLSSPPQENRN